MCCAVWCRSDAVELRYHGDGGGRFSQPRDELGDRFLDRERGTDPYDRDTAEYDVVADDRDSNRGGLGVEFSFVADRVAALRSLRHHARQTGGLEKGRSSASSTRRR